jgi:hypothetical protein
MNQQEEQDQADLERCEQIITEAMHQMQQAVAWEQQMQANALARQQWRLKMQKEKQMIESWDEVIAKADAQLLAIANKSKQQHVNQLRQLQLQEKGMNRQEAQDQADLENCKQIKAEASKRKRQAVERKRPIQAREFARKQQRLKKLGDEQMRRYWGEIGAEKRRQQQSGGSNVVTNPIQKPSQKRVWTNSFI